MQSKVVPRVKLVLLVTAIFIFSNNKRVGICECIRHSKRTGFIEQTTHEDEIRELLGKEKVSFYIGFDPTASSLTVGHFLTVMAMAHMQRAGHRPIALIGGGTVMVGIRQVRRICAA